jgi:hypothetical protein
MRSPILANAAVRFAAMVKQKEEAGAHWEAIAI